MRSILLLTLTLLLAACSDNSDNNQSTTAKTSEKETIVEQKQVAMESVTVTKTVTPVAVIEEPAVKEKEETAVNGHAIFARKCASCHGKSGEKAALNTSLIIKGWDQKRTVSALKGYKDGSYGKTMKGIMKAQVTALNDEQIDAVSDFLSTL
ncbi:MAG: c-type cytochrome [Helicobacteraceae bacterium]|jgi:cytochrome c|nr:c-type cytochrome [Helicobacteraceae bacterium]